MDTKDILAWYPYPDPMGTKYTAADLTDPEQIRTILDYCQIFEALVSQPGWDYLLRNHGLEGLYEINRTSENFSCASMEEFSSWLDYMRGMSPEELV